MKSKFIYGKNLTIKVLTLNKCKNEDSYLISLKFERQLIKKHRVSQLLKRVLAINSTMETKHEITKCSSLYLNENKIYRNQVKSVIKNLKNTSKNEIIDFLFKNNKLIIYQQKEQNFKQISDEIDIKENILCRIKENFNKLYKN